MRRSELAAPTGAPAGRTEPADMGIASNDLTMRSTPPASPTSGQKEDHGIDAALAAKDYQRLNDGIDALMRSPISEAAKFAVLWRRYRNLRHSDPVGGRILLDSTMALRGGEHLPALVREFDSHHTPGWARARLLMLIGQQHADADALPPDQVERRRAQILETVARAVNDPDAAVAREAVINHARLAQGDDGQDVLDRAYRRQLLSRHEFLRESILRLPRLADVEQQRRALQDIQASSTGADAATLRLVSETVAVALQDPSAVRALGDATRAGLARLLAGQPPDPASDASQYAMSAAASYYDWAVATGVLQGVAGHELAAYLARLASAPGTTPAQAAALMLSPRAAGIAQSATASGQSAQLRAKLQAALQSSTPATAAHSVYSAALDATAGR